MFIFLTAWPFIPTPYDLVVHEHYRFSFLSISQLSTKTPIPRKVLNPFCYKITRGKTPLRNLNLHLVTLAFLTLILTLKTLTFDLDPCNLEIGPLFLILSQFNLNLEIYDLEL